MPVPSITMCLNSSVLQNDTCAMSQLLSRIKLERAEDPIKEQLRTKCQYNCSIASSDVKFH